MASAGQTWITMNVKTSISKPMRRLQVLLLLLQGQGQGQGHGQLLLLLVVVVLLRLPVLPGQLVARPRPQHRLELVAAKRVLRLTRLQVARPQPQHSLKLSMANRTLRPTGLQVAQLQRSRWYQARQLVLSRCQQLGHGREEGKGQG